MKRIVLALVGIACLFFSIWAMSFILTDPYGELAAMDGTLGPAVGAFGIIACGILGVLSIAVLLMAAVPKGDAQ